MIEKLMTNGKTIFLAYDQGLEHGPIDFNLVNIAPDFIIKLAERAKINGIILQHGLAEKYYNKKKFKTKLIVKLNGKTRLRHGDPFSYQLCSVERALRLGAVALGYTVYPGSQYEPIMFKEFGTIVDKAHTIGLPVVAWVYPRGSGIDEMATETIAYAARIGLELGADFVKIQYNGDYEGFKWACKAAGKVKVLISGGPKISDYEFLKRVREVLDAGATGIAVGRNVWQHEHPDKMLEALKLVVYNNKTPEEAVKRLYT